MRDRYRCCFVVFTPTIKAQPRLAQYRVPKASRFYDFIVRIREHPYQEVEEYRKARNR